MAKTRSGHYVQFRGVPTLPSGSVLRSSTDYIWMRRHALHSRKVRGLICWCGSSGSAVGVYFWAEKWFVRRARTPWCVPPAFFTVCAFLKWRWTPISSASVCFRRKLCKQPSAFLLKLSHCHERVSLKRGRHIFQVQGLCFQTWPRTFSSELYMAAWFRNIEWKLDMTV